MMNYIVAENLKHRNTFLKKFIVIAPLIAILNAFVLMPNYFSVNAYNWWYVILMPASFALITAMINRKDGKKLKYGAVFSLDVSLEKVWISKVITALKYIIIAAGIHLIGVFVIQNFASSNFVPYYRFGNLFLASIVLVITNLWQIPFCLFLAKKLGFVTSTVVSVLAGISLGIIFSTSKMWLLCPYSWGIRLMVPILKINPNGTIAQITDYMVSNTNIIAPCILSVSIFSVLTFATAHWFSRLEVR